MRKKYIYSSVFIFVTFSIFALAYNTHNKKKDFFVIPAWVIEKSPAFETGQRPQINN